MSKILTTLKSSTVTPGIFSGPCRGCTDGYLANGTRFGARQESTRALWPNHGRQCPLHKTPTLAAKPKRFSAQLRRRELPVHLPSISGESLEWKNWLSEASKRLRCLGRNVYDVKCHACACTNDVTNVRNSCTAWSLEPLVSLLG